MHTYKRGIDRSTKALPKVFLFTVLCGMDTTAIYMGATALVVKIQSPELSLRKVRDACYCRELFSRSVSESHPPPSKEDNSIAKYARSSTIKFPAHPFYQVPGTWHIVSRHNEATASTFVCAVLCKP